MNFLLSIVIFSFLFFHTPPGELVEEPIIHKVHESIITDIQKGDTITVRSPASQLGLKENDRIIRINDIIINTWSDIGKNLSNKGDSTIIVEWATENGSTKSSSVTLVGRPAFDGRKIINQGLLGVQGHIIYRELNFFESIKIATINTGNIIVNSFYGFVAIISGNMPLKYVSGIVGIANVASEEASSSGFLCLMYLMAFISSNLGLINILPIPGLDGGHALISIIEGIIRRELPVKIKYAIQFIGIVLILSLFVFTIFNDIRNLFS